MFSEGLVPGPSPERGRGRGRGCGEPPRQGQGRGRGRGQVLHSGPSPLRTYSSSSNPLLSKLRELNQNVDAAAPPLPETAPKPPAIVSAHAEGVVIVEVGPNHRKYYLHKALVLFHSEYFRKALQGPWLRAAEGIVSLADIETPRVLTVHALVVHPAAAEHWISLRKTVPRRRARRRFGE